MAKNIKVVIDCSDYRILKKRAKQEVVEVSDIIETGIFYLTIANLSAINRIARSHKPKGRSIIELNTNISDEAYDICLKIANKTHNSISFCIKAAIIIFDLYA